MADCYWSSFAQYIDKQSNMAVYVTTLFFIAVFIAVIQIKKCIFCSVDSFNLLANHAGPFYEIHDSFIFSSVWQNRKSSGMLLRPKKSAIEWLIGLLLICGDIETCPVPTVKCSSCAKTIRKNQSRIQCPQCNGKFHLKCFVTNDSTNTRNACLFCFNNTLDDTQVNIADVKPGRPLENQRELPELKELLSNRGLKVLHQNIRGLLCYKHFVSELLDDFRNIHLFALSETHTTPDDNPQLQIPGYKCEPKHRETGQGGGVAIYIAVSPIKGGKIWIGTIWSVFGSRSSFPKQRVFWSVLSTSLPIPQIILRKVLAKN